MNTMIQKTSKTDSYYNPYHETKTYPFNDHNLECNERCEKGEKKKIQKIYPIWNITYDIKR